MTVYLKIIVLSFAILMLFDAVCAHADATSVRHEIQISVAPRSEAVKTAARTKDYRVIKSGVDKTALEMDQSGDGQSVKAEQELKQIEQEMADQLVKGGSDVFERYTDKTYIGTNDDGTLENRYMLINALKSGDIKYISWQMNDMRVRLYGNTAIVTYRAVTKGTYKGKDISGKKRYTDVFVKAGDRWMWVSTQGTLIKRELSSKGHEE